MVQCAVNLVLLMPLSDAFIMINYVGFMHGNDVNVAVQHILNCANVGSCYGGSVDGPYQWLLEESKKGNGISSRTCYTFTCRSC